MFVPHNLGYSGALLPTLVGEGRPALVLTHFRPPVVPYWLRVGSKFLLTVSVLAALALAVDPSALLTSLLEARWSWIVVALLLLPLNLVLDGWVWKQLLAPVVGRVSVRALTGAVLSGIALGFWTPARAGEYAGRALSLPDGDRWELSLTVLAQRMVDMAVGVNVGLLALVWAFWQGFVPLSGSWLAAAAIGLGTGAGLAAFVARPARVHRLVRWMVPNRPSITDRTALLARLSPSQGAAVVGGCLARYLVFTFQLGCLGMAFAPSAPWTTLAAGAGLTFYAKYLIPSLTLLDLGIREGSAAFFFQQLGVGAAAGLNAALVLFAVNILLPALMGLPLVSQLRLPQPSESTDARTPASIPQG